MTWSKSGKLIQDFEVLSLEARNEYFTVLGKVTHIFLKEDANNKIRTISSLTLRPVDGTQSSGTINLQLEGDWQVVTGFLQKEDIICVSNPLIQTRDYDSLDEYPVFLVMNNSDSDGSQGLGLSVQKEDSTWEELIFIQSCEVASLKEKLVTRGNYSFSPDDRALFLKASQIRQLSKRYQRKVDKPLFRNRRYSKLGELVEYSGRHSVVNVYGVVAGFRAPRPTKGHDYLCEALLIDPTHYAPGEEVSVVLFTKSPSKVIPVKCLGDILRLNAVNFRKHGAKLQLMVSLEESCVELIDGEVDEDIGVVASVGSAVPEWEDEDIQIVRQLREWARLRFSSMEGSKPSLVEKVDFKNVFLSNTKVDLVCRIESVLQDDVNSDSCLLVWDGVSYRNVGFSQKQCFVVILSLAAKQFQYVFQCPLKEDRWILLKDVRKHVQEPNNELCIMFDMDKPHKTCSTMIYLKEWMYRVQQKLATYIVSDSIVGEWLKYKSAEEEKKDLMNGSSESPCTPMNSISRIIVSPKAFRSCIRLSLKLVGFRPRDIRDFTAACCRQCHKFVLSEKNVTNSECKALICCCQTSSSQSTQVSTEIMNSCLYEYRYLFYFIFMDSSGDEIEVLVDDAVARRLFYLSQGTNLYEDSQTFGIICETLKNYLQQPCLICQLSYYRISKKEVFWKLNQLEIGNV